jgi:hypothetical protein
MFRKHNIPPEYCALRNTTGTSWGSSVVEPNPKESEIFFLDPNPKKKFRFGYGFG